MRITHVIGGLNPKAGGPPMVAMSLAAAQVGLGYSVQILSYASPQDEPAIDRAMAHIPEKQKVRRLIVPMTSKWESLLAPAARCHLATLCTEQQVFHLHGVWEPMLLAAASFAHRSGKPYVVMPHGMLDPYSLTRSRLKKKIALALAYRRMLNHAAFLHMLNEEESKLIEPLGLRAAKRIIPNGIFLQEIESLPEKGSFRRLHPQLANKPFVLFLSRLHHKKGLDYLADAFAKVASRHDRVQLVVAGPDGGEEAPFRARVQQVGLSDRVHLVGPIYGRDKYAALVDATCFCLSSRQEGFSMAILEAMACGVPVVISENCHFPQVAQARAGLVVPLNADAVAVALHLLLQSEQQRTQMGQNGRRLVRSSYTWPQIAQQIIAAYQAALNQR
ncbi:MAG: glycosyltransferase [Gammaproteobacteria bacterium]